MKGEVIKTSEVRAIKILPQNITILPPSAEITNTAYTGTGW